MSAVGVLVGLAYGLLMVAVGIALWTGFQGVIRFARGAGGAGWAAASLLVLGALLAWGSGLPALEWLWGSGGRGAPNGTISSVILMAALAVPLEREARQRAHWSRSLVYVPALVLTGVALAGLVGSEEEVVSTDWVTPIRFSLTVCAGLGARALGRTLEAVAGGSGGGDRAGSLTYGLLTLVSASAALVGLWRRGTVWVGAGPVVRGGVAGAWLAWSAERLSPSWHPVLRTVLTAGAALLLVLAAIRGA